MTARRLIGRKNMVEGAVLADDDDDMLDRAARAPIVAGAVDVLLPGQREGHVVTENRKRRRADEDVLKQSFFQLVSHRAPPPDLNVNQASDSRPL